MSKAIISIFFVCFSLAVVHAAEELRIDGSSPESYERSVKAMANSLSAKDKEVFGKGLVNLIVTRYPPASGAKGLALLQFMEAAVKAAHVTLDGVPISEILARGKELAGAGNKDAASDSENEIVRKCLQAKVTVDNATVKNAQFGHELRMDVTNNLPWAIAGIRMNYRVMSEGRSVPWLKNDMSLAISGGVEPGERRSVGASLQNVPAGAPTALIAEVEVLDVSDADERQLIRDVRVLGWAEEKSLKACQ
ncbi:MAG: hypothetical protein HC850_00815 [Rhodomicrobium sp.]|nr:hypothetical protein [Rhodomicrobium sp.]